MIRYLTIIISINFLWMASIQPYINFHYYSDTELFTEKIDLTYIGIGMNLNYSYKQFSIESDISYNFYDCLNQTPNDFNRWPGYGNIENSPGLSDNQFNFFDTQVRFLYKLDNFYFYFGRYNPIWGQGKSPIFISDKAPPFFNLGYKINISSTISYEHLYGLLSSQIENTLYSEIYPTDGYNVFSEFPRSISAHSLEYKPTNIFTIGITEIIVYGGSRSIEPYYLLPLVPFLPLQTYLGDIDNDMLGLYLSTTFLKSLNFYTSLLIDEWSPSYTFSEKDKNWFIYQIGVKKEKLFFNNDYFIIEYVYADNRVYKHRFAINDYYSYNYPVGFWGGPHSDDIYSRYSIPIFNSIFSLSYMISRRGELEDIALGKYEGLYLNQFSGIVEKKEIIKLEIETKIKKHLDLKIGYNYINWNNAGFNPMEINEENINNIIKNDFYLQLNYNFKDYHI